MRDICVGRRVNLPRVQDRVTPQVQGQSDEG